MIIVCEWGYLCEVKELLKFGVDVYFGENDIILLKVVYNSGNLGLVNLLKEYGVKIWIGNNL